MKNRGARAQGLILTSVVLFCASNVWAQDAEPLPPAPAPPPPAPAPPPPAPSSPSLAPSTRPSSSAPLERDRNWYGWQLLINDFVALGAIGGAAVAGVGKTAGFAVIIPAAVVYDLGGPTIHWLHHRRPIAAASFGVRAGVPLLGVLVGMTAASCGKDDSERSKRCRSQGTGYGALFGFAAATALDAALFGWDAPPSESRRSRAAGVGLGWTPTLTPLPGGGAAGVVGTF